MAVTRLTEFRARNIAKTSDNRVHDPVAASAAGTEALVPATALLPYLLAAGAEWGNFGEVGTSAKVRFLQPVRHGDVLQVVARNDDSAVVELAAPSGATIVSGAFAAAGDHFGVPPDTPPADIISAQGERRPLSTDGLRRPEPLGALMVPFGDDDVDCFCTTVGIEARNAGVDVAYLVAQFVPFLRVNFARRGPSVYAGVDLLVASSLVRVPTTEMRGRVDGTYCRRGRRIAVVATSWGAAHHQPMAWARHRLVYDDVVASR